MDTLILDLLDPEDARRPPMAMKDYSDEFKADAVASYESTPGAAYKSIAAGLGINRPPCVSGCCGTANAAVSPSADPDERIRQLEARVAELEANERKLATERDILRKAAKYFAGETRW
ncbi:transposase [Streptomyces sp. NPDC087659]|uniref:transposase n=1 Tax=Streptomyces sp. NPDC087659 TaxID=3365801 RepID=UPI003803D710